MKVRVVVTGANGFIGVPTIRALLEQGVEVTAYDSFATTQRNRLTDHRNLTVVEGDVRDPDRLLLALEGASTVIHLAAKHFIPWCEANPAEALDVNVIGLQRVLDAAEVAGVEQVVFASTADVYVASSTPHSEASATGPGNVYGTSKLFGEALLRHWSSRTGCRTAVARLFNVYGPGETNDHVIPQILKYLHLGNVLHLGNIHPRRDYIYVDDVADILCLLTQSMADELTINVGSGVAASVQDLVDRLRLLTGRALEIRTDPDRVRPSDRPNLQADISKLRELYPFIDPRPLDAGLEDLIACEGLSLRG